MKQLLLVFAVLAITACGGGGSGGGSDDDNTFVPTDHNTVFRIDTVGGPAVGSTESWVLTGSDNDGDGWRLTVSIQVQADTTFLGEPVTPNFRTGQLTYLPTGGFVNIISTSYAQYVTDGLYYIGFSGDTTTVAYTASLVPYAGMIGDQGLMGTYTNNIGDVDTITWEIADGGGGLAKVIIRISTVDQFGFFQNSSVETILTRPDGSEVSRTIELTDFDTGLVVTLST